MQDSLFRRFIARLPKEQKPSDRLHFSEEKITITRFYQGKDTVSYRLHTLTPHDKKRLKEGQFSTPYCLDLHHLSVPEAYALLTTRLEALLKQRLFFATIVHGKGMHSEESYAILKSHVIAWLEASQSIKAFCSAKPKDGGTGALYIMMKPIAPKNPKY